MSDPNDADDRMNVDAMIRRMLLMVLVVSLDGRSFNSSGHFVVALDEFFDHFSVERGEVVRLATRYQASVGCPFPQGFKNLVGAFSLRHALNLNSYLNQNH
jgi:hypothetical protein